MTDESGSGFRFIVDEMLGRLAKWLRAIGYDTVYHTGGGDSALVQRALEEDRVILTKDSRLVKRKLARNSILVSSDHPREQLKQVVEELDLDLESRLFTRCLICNRELVSVRKENVRGKVPIYTHLTQSKFYECPGCGRVYWPGTHKDSMLEVISSIIA
jgi:uncharacterized protein with PIN domain